MRHIVPSRLQRGRVRRGRMGSDPSFGLHGAFFIDGPCGQNLKIVASDGTDPEALGWEHVSVSCRNRPPNWQEMCFVKDLFWREAETVIQFHPKRSEYINFHPHVLHLWRRVGAEHELPPMILVGPVTEAELAETARAGE